MVLERIQRGPSTAKNPQQGGTGRRWEVLGLAQPPVDLGQPFFCLGFLTCKMGGADWL